MSAPDVVNQVRDRRLVLGVPRNEADVGAHAVEEAGARPQDYWDEVQADLVEQRSIQELLRNVCPSVDLDVLRAGCLSCPFQGCLNPVGDPELGVELLRERRLVLAGLGHRVSVKGGGRSIMGSEEGADPQVPRREKHPSGWTNRIAGGGSRFPQVPPPRACPGGLTRAQK